MLSKNMRLFDNRCWIFTLDLLQSNRFNCKTLHKKSMQLNQTTKNNQGEKLRFQTLYGFVQFKNDHLNNVRLATRI